VDSSREQLLFRYANSGVSIPAKSRLWKTAEAGQISWWEDAKVPTLGGSVRFDLDAWIGAQMLRKALGGGPPLHTGRWDGNLIVRPEKLLKHMVNAYGVKPLRYNHGNHGAVTILGSNDTMMSIDIDNPEAPRAYLQIATVKEDSITKLAKLARGILVPDDPKKGFVFALAAGMGGYSLSRIGAAGTPLERGNYTASVLDKYDHVVADLKADSPCGRLVIMSGIPGGGKTFIARALLADVPNAAFVVVPPHLVKDLGSPELVPALVQAKNHGFDGPVVLVLEDADKVLVNRAAGDMAAISSLLNLGDGILGGVIDARILATTNASTLEMDPATRRPGRLCSYMNVGDLEADHATTILRRLTGKDIRANKKCTLAQVYYAARKHGWMPPPKTPERPRNHFRDDILPEWDGPQLKSVG
jgi:ATPase family associated with various cellular activities (AAA)